MTIVRILLAEDDAQLGDALRAGLRLLGFQVDWVRDGFAALHEAVSPDYAAIVLDIGLPRIDGLTVLAQLRAAKQACPVLMLTAREASKDITLALDNGADDYVVKPVDIQVLAARLRALVRRSLGQVNNTLTADKLQLNPSSRQVWIEEKVIFLAGKEFDILYALMLADGRILTRDALEKHMYAWGQDVESNAVEVHIHHLRKKLGSYKNLVATVRGVGYRISKPSSS